MAIALLLAFGSTYLCKQIFLHMENHLEACAQLKVFKFSQKFSCLTKMAIALLLAFGSTYLCKQIFSHMENHLEACAQLKVFKFNYKAEQG